MTDKKLFTTLLAVGALAAGLFIGLPKAGSAVTSSNAASSEATVVSTTLSGDVNIAKGGRYVLEGRTDGTVYIDAGNSEVTLVLNGAEIASTEGPAIYVENADRVIIQVTRGTENTVTSSGTSEDGESSAIYSKDDLVITGSGTLYVKSEDGDGIHVNDDLSVEDTVLVIERAKDGIDVNDEYVQTGADVTVTAGKDGIKSGDSSDPAEESDVLITLSGGSLKITCEDDGIDSNASMINNGTSVEIIAGGGRPERTSSGKSFSYGDLSGSRGFPGQIQNGSFGGPSGGEFDARAGRTEKAGLEEDISISEVSMSMEAAGFDQYEVIDTASNSTSTSKGIALEGSLTVNGDLTIDSRDDGINAAGAVTVKSGMLNIRSGDDCIHSDVSVTVDGGELTLNGHEGIEAVIVTVNDGALDITASDDGINATKGSDSTVPTVTINGGSLTISMASGDTDAMDSNGNIYINGGTVSISAQFAFDYYNEGKINGGTVTVNGETITVMTNLFGGNMGTGTMPGDFSGGTFPGQSGGFSGGTFSGQQGGSQPSQGFNRKRP